MDASLSKGTLGPNVRAFVAIELPEPLRERLGRVRAGFGKQERMLKWVAPESMHITLKFLGSIARSRIADVQAAVAEAAASASGFSIEIVGLGSFPNARAPRVLWAGMGDDDGKEALGALFGSLEDALADRGFERDSRAYAPHITLARSRDTVSSTDRRVIGEIFEKIERAFDARSTVEVTHLTLMESQLSRSGPVYTPLARSRLGSREELTLLTDDRRQGDYA